MTFWIWKKMLIIKLMVIIVHCTLFFFSFAAQVGTCRVWCLSHSVQVSYPGYWKKQCWNHFKKDGIARNAEGEIWGPLVHKFLSLILNIFSKSNFSIYNGNKGSTYVFYGRWVYFLLKYNKYTNVSIIQINI